MTLHVKICGLTDLDDTLAAVEAGADLLGFNFYAPSPRYIGPAACARILDALRRRGISVTAAGVFVNAPLATVSAILERCGLDLAQLHGDEPVDMLEALGERAFKAIRPASEEAGRTGMARYARPAGPHRPALLLDAAHPALYGGSGQVADWRLAAALAAACPLLLAGGLTAENVAAAVSQVRPWGVDVASGVEERPGKKDRRKLAAFVAAARAAACCSPEIGD